MNIKALLIEKERTAYINNEPDLAAFFDAALQYILALEEQVNIKDAECERLHVGLEDLRTELRNLSDG
jgi:hypothetical protein